MDEVLEQNIQPTHKGNNKRTKIIIFSIVGLLIIAGGLFGWFKYQEKQKEKYATILAETSVEMYGEFLISSLIVSTYSTVWDTAIDNGRDFSLAISNYKEGLSEEGSLKDREKQRDKIRENMKLLQNPPKEYMESYIILKQLYGTYIKMMEQAMSPSGSLLDFNRKTNDLYSQFEQQQEELLITLPADVKKLRENYEKKKEKESDESEDEL
ncbi:hypothetical protein ABET51_06775 [Metabacillus fastidiosus]|uniref:hypothetical protein n=1 Tax=Metabacillus fastidiosus TaxID=1458 RepID=UPI003D2A2912